MEKEAILVVVQLIHMPSWAKISFTSTKRLPNLFLFPLPVYHLTGSFLTATVRKFDLEQRQSLTEFGQYAAQCLPKFIQKVQLTAGDELELLVSPEGILCVLDFLKGHHNAQFTRDSIDSCLRLDWRKLRNL